MSEHGVELKVENARTYDVKPSTYAIKGEAELAYHALKNYIRDNEDKADKLDSTRAKDARNILEKISTELKSTSSYDDKHAFLTAMLEMQNKKDNKHHLSIGGLIKTITNEETTVNKLITDYLIKSRDALRYDDNINQQKVTQNPVTPTSRK